MIHETPSLKCESKSSEKLNKKIETEEIYLKNAKE